MDVFVILFLVGVYGGLIALGAIVGIAAQRHGDAGQKKGRWPA